MVVILYKKSNGSRIKILEKYRGYNFILDDESYLTLSHTTLAGNDRFYSDNTQKTSEDNYKSRYEEKIFAISPMEMSEPYFRQQGMAVNRFVYRDEILKPCLLPLIKKYHKHDKFVFWPDQTNSHDAKDVNDGAKKLNSCQKLSILQTASNRRFLRNSKGKRP
jgi:hypothetical protein